MIYTFLYHGTQFKIDNFKVPERASLRGRGIFFSNSLRYAKKFGNFVYVCSIELKNPKLYEDDFEFLLQQKGDVDYLYDKLKREGCDGIIIEKSKVSTGRVREFIKFDPTGIKIQHIFQKSQDGFWKFSSLM